MNILITGASRGIGLGLCQRFLERGDTVFAACRYPQRAERLIPLTQQYSERLKLVPLDVTLEPSIGAAFQSVSRQTETLDLLINNAGVKFADTDFQDVTVESLRSTFEVNVLGPIMVSKVFMPLLLAAADPKLAIISSQLGSLEKAQHWGYYSYNTSKAAINMFTRMLADDASFQKLSVFALHPGWVRTELGGSSAPVRVEESVTGMMRVLGRDSADLNGRFFTYEGVEHPW